MTKTKSKKSAPRSDYRRTSTGNATTPKMTKETARFIEKLAQKDSERKKKKDAKKTEDGIRTYRTSPRQERALPWGSCTGCTCKYACEALPEAVDGKNFLLIS